jgi:hypothetical protein
MTLYISPTPPVVPQTQMTFFVIFSDSSITDGTVTFVVSGPAGPQTDQCTMSASSPGYCASDPITVGGDGTYTVTATWSGDTNHPNGTSVTQSFQVTG